MRQQVGHIVVHFFLLLLRMLLQLGCGYFSELQLFLLLTRLKNGDVSS